MWVCIDVSARASHRHAALHGCERRVNVCEVYFGDWCVVRMRTTSAADPCNGFGDFQCRPLGAMALIGLSTLDSQDPV